MDKVEPEKIEWLDKLMEDIDYYANKVWYPCFIRTGQTSDKHSWDDTCYLKSKEDIVKHLYFLAETSYMANIMLPRKMDTIVIRKMLTTKPLFYSFNNMPITKEVRCFIETENGKRKIYMTSYWPLEAFNKWENSSLVGIFQDEIKDDFMMNYIINENWQKEKITLDQIKEVLKETYILTDDDKNFFKSILLYLSERIENDWSIDFLQDINWEWYCIDMALAENSYKNTEIISLK